jgi:hypothetical protein
MTRRPSGSSFKNLSDFYAIGLSRRKEGFESPRERQSTQALVSRPLHFLSDFSNFSPNSIVAETVRPRAESAETQVQLSIRVVNTKSNTALRNFLLCHSLMKTHTDKQTTIYLSVSQLREIFRAFHFAFR